VCHSGGRRGSRTLKAHRSAVFETAAIAGTAAKSGGPDCPSVKLR
jgi:hypothetical protein